jgi:hypothetical protein
MVLEEPDIEIGAGVSSKGRSTVRIRSCAITDSMQQSADASQQTEDVVAAVVLPVAAASTMGQSFASKRNNHSNNNSSNININNSSSSSSSTTTTPLKILATSFRGQTRVSQSLQLFLDSASSYLDFIESEDRLTSLFNHWRTLDVVTFKVQRVSKTCRRHIHLTLGFQSNLGRQLSTLRLIVNP